MHRCLLVLSTVLAVSCGPSKEQREAEKSAYAAIFDNLIGIVRRQHVCDSETDALRKTGKGLERTSGMEDLGLAKQAISDADDAIRRARACQALLPSVNEARAKLLAVTDGWLDACIECAPARSCVDAERTLRKMMITGAGIAADSDPEAQKASLEAMKKGAICAKN